MKETKYKFKATDTGLITCEAITKETANSVWVSGHRKVKVSFHYAYFDRYMDAYEWSEFQLRERMRNAHRELGSIRESLQLLKLDKNEK